MKIKVKPKTYGPVYVHIDETGNLQFGEEAEQVGNGAPDLSSPAITLLYSLGSCVAISIQNVAKTRKVAIRPFMISVKASKAEDMPSRFGRIQVIVDTHFVDDRELAREICTQAKGICTISNTLNADITLGLGY